MNVIPDIYRMGGGKVQQPPNWLLQAAAWELEIQRTDPFRQYIKIETPADVLRIDPADPEASVRVHWMHNPGYIPPDPEVA